MDFPPKAATGMLPPIPPHLPGSPEGVCMPTCSQEPRFPHSLTMTMDKAGLLLLSSPDKVTIGLLSWDGPGQGLRLLLRDTDRFSSHVDGILGMLPMTLAQGTLHPPLPGNRQCRVSPNPRVFTPH